MLSDILGQLQYSPHALGQLANYARSMRHEESRRRIGLIATIIAIIIQSLSLITPPVSAAACSNNDVIECGAPTKGSNSKQWILDKMVSGDVKCLFTDTFGITKDDINAASWKNINSRKDGVKYNSVGRLAQGTAEFPDEHPVSPNNCGTPFYIRGLEYWDSNKINGSSYRALHGTSSRGQEFWILEDCGNITIRENDPAPAPTPPAPTPVTPAPVTPTPVTPTPPAPVAPTPGFDMAIDTLNCSVVDGWVFSPETPTGNTKVAIYFYSNPKANGPVEGIETFATINRSDVNNARGWSGTHGYSVAVPSSLQNGKSYVVEVLIIGNDSLMKYYKTGVIGPCGSATVTQNCTYGPNIGQAAPNNDPNQCPKFVCPAGTQNAGAQVTVQNSTTCPPVVVVTPKPNLVISKSYQIGAVSRESVVKAGQEFTYLISYKNLGPGSADNIVITDNLPKELEFVKVVNIDSSYVQKTSTTSGTEVKISFPAGTLLGVESAVRTIEITVKVKAGLAPATRFCNVANIIAKDISAVQTNPADACNTTETPIQECPYKPGSGISISDKERCRPCSTIPNSTLSFDDPACPKTIECSYLVAIVPADPASLNRKFRIASSASSPSAILGYTIDYGDGKSDTVGSLTSPIKTADNFIYEFTHNYEKSGSYTVVGAVLTTSGKKDSTNCQQPIAITTPKPAEITFAKRVRNLTQQKDDFNGGTAQPGDEMEYVLSITNIGEAPMNEYDFPTDNLSDTLDYADANSIQLMDNGYFTKDDKSEVDWPKVTIAPRSTITKRIKFTIKNPLPTTARSTSDPTKFDNKVVNVYGGAAVSFNLPTSAVKQAETVAAVLPNTGMGSNIFIIGLLLAVVSYFYARARLLRKESQMLKYEYSGV